MNKCALVSLCPSMSPFSELFSKNRKRDSLKFMKERLPAAAAVAHLNVEWNTFAANPVSSRDERGAAKVITNLSLTRRK